MLALLSPFARVLAAIAFVLLALDLYAYCVVFAVPQGETAAVVYLYKPFYGLALVAVGVLAGFLIARSNAPKAECAVRAAIVTGVSRGLGEALASTLLERGYHVLGVGRASAARLAGPNYRFIEFDLAELANAGNVLKPALAQLAAKRPEYVCLINNAAVGTPVGVLGTLDAGEIAGALAVNLAAPIALVNLFCRPLRTTRSSAGSSTCRRGLRAMPCPASRIIAWPRRAWKC